MSKEASTRPDDLATLKELVGEQNGTIVALTREVEQLKHFVAQLQRRYFGPRAEKVDPNQLTLFEQPAAEDAKPSADETPAVDVKPHKRRGGGRKPLPKHLPREVVEHDLSEDEKTCPCCGDARTRIGADRSEQLEFVPAVLKVIEHVRHKYACRKCEEGVSVAPPPSKPIAKGLPGPGLLAALVVGKWLDHLPLYRLEDVFARSGVEIPRSTLCRWSMACAELFEPLYDLMAKRVKHSRVLHTDDTTVPVLDPNQSKTKTGRFWVYCGDGANPYSVYQFTPNRERAGPEGFLTEFEGYLHSDAFAGYDRLCSSGRVQQVLCWAHARRKFFEARTVQPEPAHTALAYVGRLYGIERQAQTLTEHLDLRRQKDRDRWHAARCELRQQQSVSILAEFHDWLSGPHLDVLPKSPVGMAINYVHSRWESFTRYCDDGALSIDNNLSERMLRPCAVGRKNWLFAGNDRGGTAAAVHYTILASAKANGVEPFAYARDLLTVLPENPTDLEALLPDRWLQTHPEARRAWSR